MTVPRSSAQTIARPAGAQGSRPKPAAANRPATPPPHALILELQRTAGNRATASLVQGPLNVQRTNGESATSKESLGLLSGNLNRIAAHYDQLLAFAGDAGLLLKMALAYGFTLAPDDVRRATKVPNEHLALVEAGIVLHKERKDIRRWANDLSKKHHKSLKKKQRKVLEALLAAASNYDQILSPEGDRYATRQAVGEGDPQPVYGAQNAEVLPAQILIDNAVGPTGDCMRQLTAPRLAGKPVDQAEVNLLFDAYNRQGWQYTAAGAPSPEDLILGRAVAGVCGALAAGFLEMIKVVAKARGVDNPAYKRSRFQRFVTKPYDRGFIDPEVKGNIYAISDRRRDVTGYVQNARCTFESHTWIEAFGTIYDPLSRQTGDFSDPRFGLWTGTDVSSTGWMLEEVANPAPPKGFARGYQLRMASAKESLDDLKQRVTGLDPKNLGLK